MAVLVDNFQMSIVSAGAEAKKAQSKAQVRVTRLMSIDVFMGFSLAQFFLTVTVREGPLMIWGGLGQRTRDGFFFPGQPADDFFPR